MIDVAKATGDFVISTSCDGYENHIQRVRLQQGAKFTTVQAKLLKLNNLPDCAFISAGAFDIQLTSGNTPVKTIDGEGFKLTTVLDPELINPETGNPVVEGDKIPLWSMDSETAVWKLEKTAVIKKNANGQLYLSEEINHLSHWNWDWFMNSCNLGVTIKWEGNFIPMGKKRDL